MDKFRVKEETIEHSQLSKSTNRTSPSPSLPVPVISISSSDSDSYDSTSSSDDDPVLNRKRPRVSGDELPMKKKKKLSEIGVVLPAGFLDPLPQKKTPEPQSTAKSNGGDGDGDGNGNGNGNGNGVAGGKECRQFWKSGDFEGTKSGNWDMSTGGLDHVRVHPRFLHSNATSHQWVLGAFAELLDNALDEVCNGATYVNVDMIKNKKDGSCMLRIEDNGGGMSPEKMRQCMSLGYSLKSKLADTIGQYGNGFKTSTMRLGADVIVFSRSCGKDGKRSTQSIGLLSYTFLRSTKKEDIVVPMLDYERDGQEWKKIIRSSAGDWNKNVGTIIEWSPFSSEADLLRQFNQMKDRGTTIIIYNLWEDDQGLLELDFETDPHDIQIRGVNRDEKNIQMAKQFPNSRHFLTYKHSLRSYASILYLRIPPGFRVILRGKDVERHNVVNDMMFTQEVTYRPQPGADGVAKDSNQMVATVIVGFVKDARSHIDVQGFNVYHKNRLIKPFWRVWNASGSDGRGVIGVLEANFVEPAHDKQGFERTIVLSRLETKLVQMQKTYWSTHCHKIGYAPRGRNKRIQEEPSPECTPQSEKKNATTSKTPVSTSDKFTSQGRKESNRYPETVKKTSKNGDLYGKKGNKSNTPSKSRISSSSSETSSSSDEDINGDDDSHAPSPHFHANGNSQKASAFVSPTNAEVDPPSRVQGVRIISSVSPTNAEVDPPSRVQGVRIISSSQSKGKDASGNGMTASPSDSISPDLAQLKEQNRELRERLNRTEDEILGDLLNDLKQEKDRSKSLNAQIKEANDKIEELNKEQESLINIFSEERERRDMEEENLRKKLREASTMIQQLVDKVKLLEKSKH